MALTANATNYVYLDLTQSPPAIAVSTSGFPSTPNYKIAIAVTNSVTVTSLTDSRPSFNAAAFSILGTPNSFTAANSFTAGLTTNALTDSGLTTGNCVQATTGGLLTTTASACGTSSGTVTVTGSPASGNLSKFSGGTSITNADLSGDVSTSGGAVTTLATVATPGTNTKITFNAKGLVTAGATAQLASADFANQGTATTVLHGNASGNPSFGAVNFGTDVSSFPAACGANLFATQINTTPGCTQPAFSNLSGTITSAQFGSQSANIFLAGPNGSSGNPTFRSLVAADIPSTLSNCSGVQFAQGLNAGHTPICATPPTFVASGASHAVGYVPDPGSSAGTTRFLREDATWVAPPAGNSTVYNTTATATAASIGSTSMVTAPASDTNYRFSFEIAQTQATSGCSVAPSITVIVTYTEAFRNTSVNLNTTIASDSGVPSSTGSSNFVNSLTHYVYFGHADFRAKASTAISYSTNYFAGSGCSTGANYSIAPVLVQE